MPVEPSGHGPDVACLTPSGHRVWMEAHQSHAGDRWQACRVTRNRGLNEHRRLPVSGEIESHSIAVVVPWPAEFDDRIGPSRQRLQVRPDEYACRDSREQGQHCRAAGHGGPAAITSYRSCSNHVSLTGPYPEHTANT